ncbi:hypothetical protein KBD20_00110 [Candidatus Saccharibacteria bacterium]|nr:hypothetical protein [Candidatus Saccharibacteria bacterium]
MSPAIFVVIGTQLLFLTSDIMGRHYMVQDGFKLSTFLSLWFLGYQAVRFVATIGQLYVFTQFELGKTMTLFAVAGLVMANIAGYLLLGEVLTLKAYIAIALAITAFIILALAK